MGHLVWDWGSDRSFRPEEGVVTRRIEEVERELRDSGRTVERAYLWEGVENSRDGQGWVLRVDGEVVASAASLGGLEAAIAGWQRTRGAP